MASTTFCDWCGGEMKVAASNSPLELVGQGDGALGNSRAYLALPLPFNYHATGYTGEIDPDCCLGQLQTYLDERKSWAHDPEQEGSEWRLVPRADSVPTAPQAEAAERVEREAKWRETDERHRRWTKLPKRQRAEMIRALLESEARTAREIAEGLEAAHPEMSVPTERIRPFVAALVKSGEVDRRAEKYRDGDSIRYRYSLAVGGEA